MTLIKPEALAEPPAQKILVKAEAASEAFLLISCLHDAGYAAEVYLGGQEPADLRWILEVQDKTPIFSLTDRVKRKKFKVQTTDEVLKLLKH